MAIKNRPTLKTQFNNFINRLNPFNTNALIQKTEHNQVIQDHLDSQVLKEDEQEIVVTAATMNLDSSAYDLFIIDTSGDGGAAYTINVNNIETGQRIRVHVTKKTGDILTIPSSSWWPIEDVSNNIEQNGLLDLSFEVWNVNGELRISLLKPYTISDSIITSDSYSIASSEAVKLVNDLYDSKTITLSNDKADKDQGSYSAVTLGSDWSGSLLKRVNQDGTAHIYGNVAKMVNGGSNQIATGLDIAPGGHSPMLLVGSSSDPDFLRIQLNTVGVINALNSPALNVPWWVDMVYTT